MVRGRFFWRASPGSLRDGEQLQSVPSWDCSTRSESRFLASGGNHACADGAEAIPASLDSDRLTQSVGRRATKPVFSSVFGNQLNRCAKAFAAGVTPAVCSNLSGRERTGHQRAVCMCSRPPPPRIPLQVRNLSLTSWQAYRPLQFEKKQVTSRCLKINGLRVVRASGFLVVSFTSCQ
jgi:hypothetical protein